MKRFGAGSVTETLIKATENAEGAKNVIVMIDKGTAFNIFTNSDLTLAEAMLLVKLTEQKVLDWALDK